MFNITSLSLPLALSTAALSMAALTAPAHAQDPRAGAEDQVRIAVPYGDLNLASRSGSEALMHRVRAAARQICGPEPTNGLADVARYRSCLNATIDNAYAGFHRQQAQASASSAGIHRGA